MPSSRRGIGIPALCAAVLLAACDPVYRVGARHTLSGAAVLSPRAAPAGTPDSATGPLDIQGTGDCLEGALRASRGEVRRWPSEGHLRSTDAGMSFVVAAPTVSGFRHANLTLRSERGKPPVMEITFGWIGYASTTPLDEQKWMVAIATDVLRELRARCLPGSTGEIVCLTDGLGGKEACTAGA